MASIELRKTNHVNLCLSRGVEYGCAGFKDVHLIHNSIPEINFDEIDASVMFLGKKLSAPIIIEAMTGGFAEAERINKNLAKAADRCGIAFGLGSERAMFENKELSITYKVRDVAPSVFLIGNIGISQLGKGFGNDEFNSAIVETDCDALAVHLNILQELCQPEGDRNWKGRTAQLKQICGAGFPIIVKETGSGISRESAKLIESAGAKAIDIAGHGGTNFAIIESCRDGLKGFEGWGIPTVCSLLEVRPAVKIPVIASGGVRSGIDMAKSIALGADMCGAALPFLRAATISDKAVEEKIMGFVRELKTTMMLTGCRTLAELKKSRYVLTGFAREWKEQRLR